MCHIFLDMYLKIILYVCLISYALKNKVIFLSSKFEMEKKIDTTQEVLCHEKDFIYDFCHLSGKA